MVGCDVAGQFVPDSPLDPTKTRTNLSEQEPLDILTHCRSPYYKSRRMPILCIPRTTKSNRFSKFAVQSITGASITAGCRCRLSCAISIPHDFYCHIQLDRALPGLPGCVWLLVPWYEKPDIRILALFYLWLRHGDRSCKKFKGGRPQSPCNNPRSNDFFYLRYLLPPSCFQASYRCEYKRRERCFESR